MENKKEINKARRRKKKGKYRDKTKGSFFAKGKLTLKSPN